MNDTELAIERERVKERFVQVLVYMQVKMRMGRNEVLTPIKGLINSLIKQHNVPSFILRDADILAELDEHQLEIVSFAIEHLYGDQCPKVPMTGT